jgi:topoisomerase IV subunit B
MYTRTTCPTHIVQEVIDNAADEALGGYANAIAVTVNLDGSIDVADNGRGIPVDIHPEEGRPAIELIFCKLHAGAKFDKTKGDASYRFSGGLHGVGVSVTNALSTRLEVEVRRDGGVHQMAFGDGYVVQELVRTGDCERKQTGTRVRIWPNAKYFDSPKVNLTQLEHLLRSKAVLMPGVRVLLTIERAEGKPTVHDWRFKEGMSGYLQELAVGLQPLVPIYAGKKFITDEGNAAGFALGEGAEYALAWFEDGGVKSESYVNLIPTLDGGTHEAGLKAGVFDAVRAFADHHSLLPAKVKLAQEDVTGRLAYLLSARILDPQFAGQTKEKLTSRDAYKLVTQMVKDPLELWLNQHVEFGRKIAELAVKSAQARQRAADKVEKKRGSGLATLPGKLTDCESEDIARNELFLVEGDSAGGSAKQGRNKEFQAILPLRGKVLNTWEVDRDQLFKNTEVHDISVAIGVDPHTLADIDKVDLTGLRYGKIIVMSDADVDGSHIQVLLLTLFLRHFPALVERGNVLLAQPPLFRLDAQAKGKLKKVYCLDEAEREQMLQKLKDEGIKEHQIEVQRFKGLGEMNPDQLWETTLCPGTRRLVEFQVGRDDIARLSGTFHLLMGKGEAAGRRAWMEREGNSVEADL